MSVNFEFNIFEIILLIISITLLVLYVLNSIKLSRLRKNYADFMSKIGKGENIDDMLHEYIKKVEDIKNENAEIEKYCEKLDNQARETLKKIGLIRYNAYKDTGSNLSFALSILNENNTGIVLNGIYGRDTSNIYAKPVVDGKSEYALSREEEQAIQQAIEKK